MKPSIRRRVNSPYRVSRPSEAAHYMGRVGGNGSQTHELWWGHRNEAPDLGNAIQCSLLARETSSPSMTAVEVYIGAGGLCRGGPSRGL